MKLRGFFLDQREEEEEDKKYGKLSRGATEPPLHWRDLGTPAWPPWHPPWAAVGKAGPAARPFSEQFNWVVSIQPLPLGFPLGRKRLYIRSY